MLRGSNWSEKTSPYNKKKKKRYNNKQVFAPASLLGSDSISTFKSYHSKCNNHGHSLPLAHSFIKTAERSQTPVGHL